MSCWRRGGYEPIDQQHWQVLDHNCPKNNTGAAASLVSDRQASADDSSDDLDVTFRPGDALKYYICGFERSWRRSLFFHTVSVLLLGLPYIVAIWWPSVFVYKYKKCDLLECDIVLLKNNVGLATLIKVRSFTSAATENTAPETFKLFVYEETRYVFDNIQEKFIALKLPHENQRTISELCSDQNGILEDNRQFFINYYGDNEMHVNVKSYWKLFVDEIVNPFYIFQIASLIFWCLDDYYYYAMCILILSGVSIGTSLYETRKQSITLRDLVEKSRPQCVKVKQRLNLVESQITQMSPVNLCPGDILLVENDFILPCDCLLLEGACIVNECMLTGESVPINKVAVDMSSEYVFTENRFKRSILYAGTEVIQVKTHLGEFVRAKVLNVGFKTNKGELIRSILYPKPITFKFYRDSIRFVTALFCVGIFGMIYTVRLFMRRNEEVQETILKTLDVITIVVPPSLPVAMTAGTIYSQSRLKSKGIFCVSPPQINVCGKMKLCCFDKTGTLTEDGLTFYGLLSISSNKMISGKLDAPTKFSIFDKLIQGLATCHSLISHNGSVIGDPLELEMFNATDWVICNENIMQVAVRAVMPKSEQEKSLDNDVPYVIGTFKEFEFTSEEQCMSVLVKILGHNNYLLFAKGAPERIRQMMDDKSIPKNFDETLNEYTNSGYRVLALAYREFSAKTRLKDLLKRDRKEMEKELQMLGFIVFQNQIKPETTPTVEALKKANLRIVMATGDNILTAISVAKESDIVSPDEKIFHIELNESHSKLLAKEIKSNNNNNQRSQSDIRVSLDSTWNHHFALDGSSWEAIRTHRPDLLANVLAKGTIFARFRPEQKSQLVMGLQELDYIVTMCGDGANDCTALKTANIGVSLSQAEASIAAPFTSKNQNIECIKHLALEGRCALVTSFSLFKYIILYSMIQFATVEILYTYCTPLGDTQFLYIDLAITASIAFTMGLQRPRTDLVPQRPSSSLISPLNVIPLVLQIVMSICYQIGAVAFLTSQNWYDWDLVAARCAHNETTMYKRQLHGGVSKAENEVSWENTVVFLISCFQYLVLGLIYSKGKPFRKPFYTNGFFMSIFLSLTTFTTILLLYPPEVLSNFFNIERFLNDTSEETYFRYYLLLFPFFHIVTSVLIEFGMAERRWLKRCIHWLTRKTRPRNKFKQLQSTFSVDESWIEFL